MEDGRMIQELLRGFGVLLVYYAICGSVALLLRLTTSMPSEVFRKTLHFILLGTVFILTYGFETWWISALSSLLFILIVYPILLAAERIPGYSRLMTERNSGEIKRSLIAASLRLLRRKGCSPAALAYRYVRGTRHPIIPIGSTAPRYFDNFTGKVCLIL